jgi:hypothetical protein
MITNKTSRKRSIDTLIKAVLLLALTIGMPLTGCKTTRKAESTAQQPPKVKLVKNNAEDEKDSVEYELIVLDPKFESWLATQPSPHFYSQQYYESWNRLYVSEWNHRHNNPLRYGSFYATYIDYDPHIDYGLELNYRLYYYFRFIEDEYGIVLIPRGR